MSQWQPTRREIPNEGVSPRNGRPPTGQGSQNGTSKQPKILFNLLSRENQTSSQNSSGGYDTPPGNSSIDLLSGYTPQYTSALAEMCQMWSVNGDFLAPSRPRSKSMGNAGWRLREVASASTISRTPSRDSLASYDESNASDDGATRWNFGSVRSDLEVALQKLTTTGDNSPVHRSNNASCPDIDVDQPHHVSSHSQPGSPPSSHHPYPAYRKNSDCSQLMRNRRVGFRTWNPPPPSSDHHGPVDLSCRRKKFEYASGLPYSRPATAATMRPNTSNISLDEGIDDESVSSDGSLLKSILTGRVRSNSMSVMSTSSRRPTMCEYDVGKQMLRRRVTLAKKNLLPVTARITDLLLKIADFVRSLACFQSLSTADQRALLANACPRLLLLDMAWSNVEFAVTAVRSSAQLAEEDGEAAASVSMDDASSGQQQLQQQAMSADSPPSGLGDADIPTQQFVETVRNFVRKCQAFGITSDEYTYMRLITLFQLGVGTAVERADLADAINTEARQRLAELVQRSHQTEKLRYSTLLLALHTLFGVNTAMIQSLLFRPSATAATIDEYVWNMMSGSSSSSSGSSGNSGSNGSGCCSTDNTHCAISKPVFV